MHIARGLTVSIVGSKDVATTLGDINAVAEGLLSEVEVDEGGSHTDFSHTQPEADILWAGIHHNGHHITLAITSLMEEVGHLVGILIHLAERPLPAITHSNQGHLFRVLADIGLKDVGQILISLEVVFDVSLHAQQVS